MALKPPDRQARRENVSARAAARDLIETVQNMSDDELAQLRSALDGEAVSVVVNPKRAYAEEALDPMGAK
jgi:hypothetical protein